MKPWLKWTLGVLIVLGVALFFLFRWFQGYTKSFSPEETVTYTQNGLDVSVFYNRPYKKGRAIFGELVPYGETWRTGANEATTFDTKTDLLVAGKPLPAGHYTLWTVPGPESWQVIWNGRDYPWGVSWGAKASRQTEFDIQQVEVPVQQLPEVVEQFTISFPNGNMALSWDQTRVIVPMQAKDQENPTTSMEHITRFFGQLTADAGEVQAQEGLPNNQVSFADAVQRAEQAVLHSTKPESPRDLVTSIDEQPSEEEEVVKAIRTFTAEATLHLVPRKLDPEARPRVFPPENGESVADNWVFYFKLPTLSDHLYWAIVDRTGEKEPYCYGFN